MAEYNYKVRVDAWRWTGSTLRDAEEFAEHAQLKGKWCLDGGLWIMPPGKLSFRLEYGVWLVRRLNNDHRVEYLKVPDEEFRAEYEAAT
jgi:hypothetical protein